MSYFIVGTSQCLQSCSVLIHFCCWMFFGFKSCKNKRSNRSIQKTGRTLLNITSFIIVSKRIIIVINDNIGGVPAGPNTALGTYVKQETPLNLVSQQFLILFQNLRQLSIFPSQTEADRITGFLGQSKRHHDYC